VNVWKVRPGSIRRHMTRARRAGAITPSAAVNTDTRRAAREQVAGIGEYDLAARMDHLGQVYADAQSRRGL
jgi:hypothetical protein